MQTRQLKRIVIIILALVNLSLLALLGRSVLEQRRSNRQTLMQLKDLYLSCGIDLTLEELPDHTQRGVASVQRSSKNEQRFSSAFLGTVTQQESGSAMLYTSPTGTMRLRRNSAFDLTLTQPTLNEEKALALLEEFGYASPSRSDDGATLTLTQTIQGESILGATATLHFREGLLTSMEGYCIASPQEENGVILCGAADALCAFLEQSLAEGFVYGQVRAMYSAQKLSVETLFQSSLLPVWVIETDAAVYYVNYDASEIS